MPRAIINGSPAPIIRPTEVDSDPVRGLVVNKEFVGAGPDSLAGLATYYYTNRIAYKWHRGLISTLQPMVSGGQDGIADEAQMNFELLGNEIQKHIFESPVAMSGLATYALLVDHVKAGWKMIEDGDTQGEIEFGAGLSAGEGVYYDYLIGKLLRGQTHFAAGQYVVKRSISVSNFYAGSVPGDSLVECVLSTGTLLSGPCSEMPPVMSQAVSAIPARTAHTGYAWGWRQLPSRMVTSAQNRVEHSTEWWLEEWDTSLYSSLL